MGGRTAAEDAGGWLRRTRSVASVDRVTLAVVGVAALAVVARLVRLGGRVFHFDEAWVGYWTLRAAETGVWEYRPIVHGPFFFRVNAPVFGLLGASDFSARLAVAVVGGLLPLVALLLRSRLRDDEVLALGLLLAASPLLLYYSRFMRNDLPLAAFALFALGFAVRWLDRGRARDLYAAAVAAGLAVTTKESAVLYVPTFLGAAVLVADDRLLRARARGTAAGTAVRAAAGRVARGLRAWWAHLLGAAAASLAVVVYFYAPRAAGAEGPGLWKVAGDPEMALPVLAEATVGAAAELHARWVSGGMQDHPYLPYLLDTLETLAAGAPAVVFLAPLGFLVDRYLGDRPRDVVALTAFAGVLAALGFPLANFLPVPWSTVHAAVPLAVPAAVGAAWVYRRGRAAAADRDYAGATLATVVLVVAVVAAGTTAVSTSYLAPSAGGSDGSQLVYDSQPPADLRPVLDRVEAAVGAGSGTDVLYVGESLATADETAADRPPPPGSWLARMPLPWYTEQYGADVASVPNASAMGADAPPVVVATPGNRDAVAARLDGYAAYPRSLDQIDDRRVVVFVAGAAGNGTAPGLGRADGQR